MIAVLNFLVAIGLTIIYSINQGIQLNFLGILWILLAFVISFIIVCLVFSLFFLGFIFATEKMNRKAKWKHFFVKAVSRYMFRFFYRVRLITTGKENLPKDDNFVMYSNHIEYTDPIFIVQVYKKNPMAFVAKEPLFKYFGLKNLLLGMGCIPITKYADRSALKTILQAIKQVKEGQPMGVFPEGKRTYSNDLIAFKPGAFKVAQKGQADISPVCLYDMHKLNGRKGILPTKVYIHILPVIKYEDYKDMDSVALSKKVYNMIDEQLNKFKAN
jgi:1-acyl-sn-glycerol-3-phosphate acyltransferase